MCVYIHNKFDRCKKLLVALFHVSFVREWRRWKHTRAKIIIKARSSRFRLTHHHDDMQTGSHIYTHARINNLCRFASAPATYLIPFFGSNEKIVGVLCYVVFVVLLVHMAKSSSHYSFFYFKWILSIMHEKEGRIIIIVRHEDTHTHIKRNLFHDKTLCDAESR